MKRSMCGIALLAAATALWSCNGDPTGSIRDEGQKVLADPSSLFLGQGETKFVTVELVDGQGNQLAADFTPQNVGAAVTVEKDTTFLQTSTGSPIQTSSRFIVTGVSPASTSFDLVGGGVSGTVPVRVTPASTTVTLSTATPASNEGLVVTLPAGYKFGPGAGVSVAGVAGITQGFSADSTALTVIVPPLTTGTITVDSVAVDFVPGVLFSLPTEQTVTVGAATPAAGTGSPSTAPALAVPVAGATTGFFDAGTFTAPDITTDGGIAGQYYKLTITEEADYTFTVNWGNTADIDMELCSDVTCSDGGAFLGTGVDQPETDTVTLTPGTYYFETVLFGGTAPPWVGIAISR
jgi:hypothetical protein